MHDSTILITWKNINIRKKIITSKTFEINTKKIQKKNLNVWFDIMRLWQVMKIAFLKLLINNLTIVTHSNFLLFKCKVGKFSIGIRINSLDTLPKGIWEFCFPCVIVIHLFLLLTPNRERHSGTLPGSPAVHSPSSGCWPKMFSL